jgi:hypothetical protein
MKRILAPRPLIAKKAHIVLPAPSGEAAYDFVVGDLVAPHGKGVSPDVWFVWSRPAKTSTMEAHRSWDLAFREPGSGAIAQLFSGDSGVLRSALVSEQSAPTEGYLPSLRAAETAAGFDQPDAWIQETLYYFRIVREGAPLYGTFIGERPRILYYQDNPRPVVKLSYTLNPSGDRSVEPDPNASTFPRANA